MDSKDKSVVSVLSLGASVLAVLCFVTGRTSLKDFVVPHAVPASASTPLAVPTISMGAGRFPVGAHTSPAETENLLLQAAFFVHTGHLAGHGTDNYDADDTEQDWQNLISKLEMYIVFASDKPPEKARLIRAQDLRHRPAQMHPDTPAN